MFMWQYFKGNLNDESKEEKKKEKIDTFFCIIIMKSGEESYFVSLYQDGRNYDDTSLLSFFLCLEFYFCLSFY